MYRDGWTVSGGIGHKFNDQWSAAGQISWDQGRTWDYVNTGFTSEERADACAAAWGF